MPCLLAGHNSEGNREVTRTTKGVQGQPDQEDQGQAVHSGLKSLWPLCGCFLGGGRRAPGVIPPSRSLICSPHASLLEPRERIYLVFLTSCPGSSQHIVSDFGRHTLGDFVTSEQRNFQRKASSCRTSCGFLPTYWKLLHFEYPEAAAAHSLLDGLGVI